MTHLLRRAFPALVLALGAGALGGCLTHTVHPSVSQAVLDARAHKDVEQSRSCAALTSPTSVGFGFGEPRLSDLAIPELQSVAAELACHPQATAVVVGAADAHGSAAEQQALAQARSQAVVEWLENHGIAAGRLTSQVQGKKPPTGDETHLVILAEGRRW